MEPLPKATKRAHHAPGGGGGQWKDYGKRNLAYGSDNDDPVTNAIAETEPSGTSIFDPVLCEMAYRWFSPPDGVVVDPFAGGSVRGIVASKLGRRYYGVDLCAGQLVANREQANSICQGHTLPQWVEGDSEHIVRLLPKGLQADFLFSCPPYADLEVYSEDPRDLSNMPYESFREKYTDIILEAASLLKPDRFACFVVGDARGPDGCYYGLPGDTVNAFRAAGLKLYNEGVLVTSVGSLPLRVGAQFTNTRKWGKTHQNILVFIKGDPKEATRVIGPVDFGMADVLQDEAGDRDGYPVKISAKSARLMFTECGPACIEQNGCGGNCCDAPSKPGGCLVTVHPSEAAHIAALGGVVENGRLVPEPGQKGCPFKHKGLCAIHKAGKPFGCVASPFTVNKAGTLIVRNRYKLLPCYKGGGAKAEAYKVFRTSLVAIFGEDEAARITAHLDGGGDDLMATALPDAYRMLIDNDAAKKVE